MPPTLWHNERNFSLLRVPRQQARSGGLYIVASKPRARFQLTVSTGTLSQGPPSVKREGPEARNSVQQGDLRLVPDLLLRPAVDRLSVERVFKTIEGEPPPRASLVFAGCAESRCPPRCRPWSSVAAAWVKEAPLYNVWKRQVKTNEIMAARLSGERTRGRPENVAFSGYMARKATFNWAADTRVRCALSVLKSPWARELEDAVDNGRLAVAGRRMRAIVMAALPKLQWGRPGREKVTYEPVS